jgi:hypothetical protein
MEGETCQILTTKSDRVHFSDSIVTAKLSSEYPFTLMRFIYEAAKITRSLFLVL